MLYIVTKGKNESMLNLSLLTRNFHDQLCEKVILNNNILSVYIHTFELGDKYYYDTKCEERTLESDLDEVSRTLVINFYNVTNINDDFELNFEDSLDIYDLIISGNNVIFNMYYDDGKSNKLSFNADGFDIEYLED